MELEVGKSEEVSGHTKRQPIRVHLHNQYVRNDQRNSFFHLPSHSHSASAKQKHHPFILQTCNIGQYISIVSTLYRMSQHHPLHGGCSCGRNKYTVSIPNDAAEVAQVFFDSSAAHRTVHPSPGTTQIKGNTS